jgi:hypothetical protein
LGVLLLWAGVKVGAVTYAWVRYGNCGDKDDAAKPGRGARRRATTRDDQERRRSRSRQEQKRDQSPIIRIVL